MIMGAIVVSVMVIMIAVVGYVYFNKQDKNLKDERK